MNRSFLWRGSAAQWWNNFLTWGRFNQPRHSKVVPQLFALYFTIWTVFSVMLWSMTDIYVRLRSLFSCLALENPIYFEDKTFPWSHFTLQSSFQSFCPVHLLRRTSRHYRAWSWNTIRRMGLSRFCAQTKNDRYSYNMLKLVRVLTSIPLWRRMEKVRWLNLAPRITNIRQAFTGDWKN